MTSLGKSGKRELPSDGNSRYDPQRWTKQRDPDWGYPLSAQARKTNSRHIMLYDVHGNPGCTAGRHCDRFVANVQYSPVTNWLGMLHKHKQDHVWEGNGEPGVLQVPPAISSDLTGLVGTQKKHRGSTSRIHIADPSRQDFPDLFHGNTNEYLFPWPCQYPTWINGSGPLCLANVAFKLLIYFPGLLILCSETFYYFSWISVNCVLSWIPETKQNIIPWKHTAKNEGGDLWQCRICCVVLLRRRNGLRKLDCAHNE